MNEKVVLIAVVGMSPAVITETIWGLGQEKPEFLPDEVKVCTTRTGWDALSAALLSTQAGCSVWEELQAKLGKKITLSKHIFHNDVGSDLEDIVSGADQELVANQLLKCIREYKNPQQEVCRIVASIAGGRKSMSALMYAAMSLGAEPDDIITHVLADEKATNCRAFFFPAQSQQQLVNKQQQEFTAKEVRIDLAEIPFVPLASLVKGSDFESGGAFSKLVRRARQTVANISREDTKIRISRSSCTAWINGQEIRLHHEAYALLAVMVFHLTVTKDQCITLKQEDIYQHLIQLRDNNWLPAELITKAKQAKESGRVGIFDKKKWQDDNLYRKVKHKLKTALESDFPSVVADAFGHGTIGFQRIHNVKPTK